MPQTNSDRSLVEHLATRVCQREIIRQVNPMSYPLTMMHPLEPDPEMLRERRQLLAEYIAENPDWHLRTLVADALVWRIRQQAKAILEDEEA
jgi:hypothetical protein